MRWEKGNYLCENPKCKNKLDPDHVTLATTQHVRRFCTVDCLVDSWKIATFQSVKGKRRDEFEPRIVEAVRIAGQYGSIDGDHHKAWVIDQMVRKLIGNKYDEFIELHKAGEDVPDTYSWDTGIAP